jgi:hypothetical protein
MAERSRCCATSIRASVTSTSAFPWLARDASDAEVAAPAARKER